MTDAPELLAWVDVETTGLDPVEDYLLSVAWVITDLTGKVVEPGEERVVYYPDCTVPYAQASGYVREMHGKTGLWNRLGSYDSIPTYALDQELYLDLKSAAPEPRSIRLAGNSVRLDLNFLERNLPNAYAHLHYRSVDVSALAYALHSWGVITDYYPKKGTHNALDDIQESIDEYKYLRAATSQG